MEIETSQDQGMDSASTQSRCEEDCAVTLLQGDCLEVLKTIPEHSIDSLVTDPPAGISFMGKGWDGDKGGRKEWCAWMEGVMRECLRVMKPGAHGLVWALPRTSHWTATALEDAGFEIRDCVYHLFGSGFPKSLDVSKAIDKAAGAERKTIGQGRQYADEGGAKDRRWEGGTTNKNVDITAPATDAAKQWQGFGTALKPAVECWWLVRKPCSEKTVAANVLKWGCGALNIDGSRIGYTSESDKASATPGGKVTSKTPKSGYAKASGVEGERHEIERPELKGRFPSHLLLSHSPYCTDDQCDIECACAQLDAQSGERGVSKGGSRGASRFFYCAKVSSSERNAGLEGMPDVEAGIGDDRPSGQSMSRLDGRPPRVTKNHHPTVKPQKLMRYLARLITPPGGTVLDPFMGSGSTGLAAKSEGFGFVGIEREQEYFEIAQKRMQ